MKTEKERLDKLMSTIEDEQNYYAYFDNTYCLCPVARELAHRLFDEGVIEDYEFVGYGERIGAARSKMIATKKAWLTKRLTESKSDLTREHIVSSVMYDIFGEASLEKKAPSLKKTIHEKAKILLSAHLNTKINPERESLFKMAAVHLVTAAKKERIMLEELPAREPSEQQATVKKLMCDYTGIEDDELLQLLEVALEIKFYMLDNEEL